jgi:hypothetical protein
MQREGLGSVGETCAMLSVDGAVCKGALKSGLSARDPGMQCSNRPQIESCGGRASRVGGGIAKGEG